MTVAEAIEISDVKGAVAVYDDGIGRGKDPWKIHLQLFRSVQGVLNPPFINPHLPKMHAICRDFLATIRTDEDLAALVRLEVAEYARRPKLEKTAPPPPTDRRTSFGEIEASISGGDRSQTAALMCDFCRQYGMAEFSRRLLLLGSGYLDDSLGHSISCTSFILLEMMERSDSDRWPTLAALAEYFHKGRFSATPTPDIRPVPAEEVERHLLRATSGTGIIELHDTITIYTIDRVRHLFAENEFLHLVNSWISFLGDKEAKPVAEPPWTDPPGDYPAFREAFERLDPDYMIGRLAPLLESDSGRSRLAGYLLKGVCDLYRGQYNPHNITGLGSLFWVFDRFPERRQILLNATYQYLGYFFSEMRVKTSRPPTE